jgi:quinohemoprotein ethanol dehydrogenase
MGRSPSVVRAIVLGVCISLLLAGCNRASGSASAGAPNPQDWPAHNGGDDESSYSALDVIDTGNIERLGLAWALDLPGEMALEATPLAIGGKLFFTGSMSDVYAVDGATGKLLWQHSPEVWNHMPQHMRKGMAVNRGAAYADGRVFAGTMDGRLIALDAGTGKLLWSVETIAAEAKRTISGAPRVCAGKVVIGNSGGDWGERGYVTAYDAATGKQAWRFYTAPGDPAKGFEDEAQRMAAATWRGDWWKTGTGGTVWNGITCDPELNQLYIGTGNSGPYDPEVRSPGGGDNLFLASIVALDPATGRYRWHYQLNPREAWDYKAVADMQTATLVIDGAPRKVLMQAPTNGFFYVLDRTNGKVISAEKITKVSWAKGIDLKTGRPIEMPGIRYEKGPVTMWPSPTGAHNWQAMSFNPKTGLVYIPAMKLAARYARVSGATANDFTGMKGAIDMTPALVDKDDGTATLLAWDPIAQKKRWEVRQPSFWNGGVMSTGGGVVFQGNGAGKFEAFDADDGAKLWSFDAGHGIVGAPISYQAQGKQYVSILVGWGGGVMWSNVTNQGWKYGAQPRRLLTFALDGKAKLPRGAPADMKVRPVDDPALVLDERRVASGAIRFGANCAMCHGLELVSPGVPAPDLRESQLALSLEDLRRVVKGGALVSRGMPRFDDLSDRDIEDIYHYIRAGAREALGTRVSPRTAKVVSAHL